MDNIKGNAVVVGAELFLISDPDAQGSTETPDKFSNSMLIQFNSQDDLRKAIQAGAIEFTVFGD